MSMINELDLRSLWKELDDYEKELNAEKNSLQDVWVKIATLKTSTESQAKELMSKKEFTFVDAETHICFNVGGQLFETTAGVLTRDPYSILAAVCRVEPIFHPNEDGIFFFDRDWWLFRHILSYLRSNVLPNELETLKELYAEASYYRLESLQRAIEDIPIDQISNHTPQISVTWPGLIDGNPNPLRRSRDNYVLDETMFQNLA